MNRGTEICNVIVKVLNADEIVMSLYGKFINFYVTSVCNLCIAKHSYREAETVLNC
jgi:hypothetical protein